jgi:hypothetical protein
MNDHFLEGHRIMAVRKHVLCNSRCCCFSLVLLTDLRDAVVKPHNSFSVKNVHCLGARQFSPEEVFVWEIKLSVRAPNS